VIFSDFQFKKRKFCPQLIPLTGEKDDSYLAAIVSNYIQYREYGFQIKQKK
jgi:hypothetical protein